MRVLAKNQLRFEISEKTFACTYENLNGKFILTDFLSGLPGPLSFYTALENNIIFLQQFFRFGGFCPPLAGVHGVKEILPIIAFFAYIENHYLK